MRPVSLLVPACQAGPSRANYNGGCSVSRGAIHWHLEVSYAIHIPGYDYYMMVSSGYWWAMKGT